MRSKKRQTFGKRDRERAVLEKRARKQEKKDQRKLDAQAAQDGDSESNGGDGSESDAPAAVETPPEE